MARARIEDGQLIISMKGIRKFLAMKNEVSVPLTSIVSVATGFDLEDLPKTLEKVLGSNSDTFYTGGRFREGGFWNLDGDKWFFDLRTKEAKDAIVITLKDDEFKKLVIGCENPSEIVALIEQALDNR